jgi:hypothetical protein
VTEHTTTQCVLFPGIFKRPVVAQFDQTQGSSDGGAVLLKAADQKLDLTAALAACLEDERQVGKIRHELDELLTQRIMAIACGYEDTNDTAGAWFDTTGSAVLERSTALALSMVPAGRLELSVTATCTVCWPPTAKRPSVATTCAA